MELLLLKIKQQPQPAFMSQLAKPTIQSTVHYWVKLAGQGNLGKHLNCCRLAVSL